MTSHLWGFASIAALLDVGAERPLACAPLPRLNAGRYEWQVGARRAVLDVLRGTPLPLAEVEVAEALVDRWPARMVSDALEHLHARGIAWQPRYHPGRWTAA